MNIGSVLLVFWIVLELALGMNIFYSYQGSIETRLVRNKVLFVISCVLFGTSQYFILVHLRDASGAQLAWQTAALAMAGMVTASLLIGAIVGRYLWHAVARGR